MPSTNTYPGYVKIPGKKLYLHEIRLDFNCHIVTEPSRSKLDGFTLRLFHTRDKSTEEHPEISVTVSTEQWLDLIDAMREEFEYAQKNRKLLDDEAGDDGWEDV